MSGNIEQIKKAVLNLKEVVLKISVGKNNPLVNKLDKFLDAVEKKKVAPQYAAAYLNDILFKQDVGKTQQTKSKKSKKIAAVFISEENIEPLIKKYFRELKSQ